MTALLLFGVAAVLYVAARGFVPRYPLYRPEDGLTHRSRASRAAGQWTEDEL